VIKINYKLGIRNYELEPEANAKVDIRTKPEISGEQVKKSLDIAVQRVKGCLPRFTYKSQNHSSVNNIYPAVENDQWTAGFWPGQIWLAYLYTKEPIFKYAGLIQSESLLERIKAKIEVDHHDMGFLYTPSCTAAWQITGDLRSREAAILAADQMLTRFQEKGGFFQAWGSMGAADNYRFIIDCLMNLPLLYWATEETGNPIYAEKAAIHAKTCLAHSFREDNSTFHTFFMNPEAGGPVRGETCQGYADDSSWARGQAWAVYGAAIMYRYTNDAVWLDTFYKVTDYFLQRLPQDLVPYWDLIFTEGDEPRDSSSSAIVACGLLEMAEILKVNNQTENVTKDQTKDQTDNQTNGIFNNKEQAEQLTQLAKKLMYALSTSYTATDNNTDGLLLHGTYSKKSPYNTCTPEGVDECLTWGDYFYLEALLRLDDAGWRGYW